MEPESFDAVVLAGGSGSRLGGADKASVEVGGVPLLLRVLHALSDAGRIVVVGPRRHLPAPSEVMWAREHPSGGGPAVALAAGLDALHPPSGPGSVPGVAPRDLDVVVVLAADLPFVERRTVEKLVAAARKHDGALLVDEGGRDQYLAGAYRAAAVSVRLTERPGASMRAVLEDLDLVRVHAGRAALDCDTWEDVEAARALMSDGRARSSGPGH
ncbi:MAG: NTP transferase domain-containing protein [Actinobacteria bacterium]|nr:NTP transferase domain-containing protein [Actinomycetota bacterium]